MKRAFSALFLLVAVVTLGWGCSKKTPLFISAPQTNDASSTVTPNSQGAQASTGNLPTTLTPEIDPAILARALPDDNILPDYKAGIAQEQKNPVPKPDGTRTEYSTMMKTYSTSTESGSKIIQVAITDTRSLPVLTAFLDSFQPYKSDSGYREQIQSDQNVNAWLTYMNAPDADSGGFGSVTMLLRGRFLVQIQGNKGVTSDELKKMASGIHQDALK